MGSKFHIYFVLNLIITRAKSRISSDFILLLLGCHISNPGKYSKHVIVCKTKFFVIPLKMSVPVLIMIICSYLCYNYDFDAVFSVL